VSEWDEYLFSNLLVDESISYGIVQPGEHVETESVPVVRVKDIKDGRINNNDILKVSSSIEEKYKRTRLRGGELLITVVGSVGECAIVPESLRGWNVARAVSVANIKDDFDIHFVKYCFKLEEVIFQIYGNTNDTVQPTLNLSSLKKIKILVPPLPKQKAIASVLSSLDDKIDLLHRQNKTLEAMAETLFRQWFVEEAQDDWEEKSLYDCIELIGGGTPQTSVDEYWNGDILWISAKDITPNHKGVICTTEKKITREGLENSSTKILPKFSMIISARGTVGKYAILLEDMAFSQSNYGIIPKYSKCYFFYLFTRCERC